MFDLFGMIGAILMLLFFGFIGLVLLTVYFAAVGFLILCAGVVALLGAGAERLSGK